MSVSENAASKTTDAPEIKPNIILQTRHETIFLIEGREYQITGLSTRQLNNFNFTLKLSKDDNFCLQKVNLSRPKSRQDFVDEARDILFYSEEILHKDIRIIMKLVEKMQRDQIQREQEDREACRPVFEFTSEEEAWAISFLKDTDILFGEYLRDIEKLGYIGDTLGKKVLFLAAHSRKCVRPLSVLSVANSSAGKSFSQKTVLSLFPEDEVKRYARLTPNSISHFGRYELAHKIVNVDELSGMEESALGQLRSLLSDGKFTLGYANSDTFTRSIETAIKEIYGPVAFITSTTHEELIDDETRNRFIILKVDESKEQTRKVIESIISRHTEGNGISEKEKQNIIRKYKLIAKVIKPMGVKIPSKLASGLTFSQDKLTFKRKAEAFMTMIETIALLRQYRKIVHSSVDSLGNSYKYIRADERDITDAVEIMSEIYGDGFESLTPVNRSILQIIASYGKLRAEGKELSPTDVTWTRKEIRDFCGWEHVPVSRAINKLMEMEYVVKIFGKERSLHHYKLNLSQMETALLLGKGESLGGNKENKGDDVFDSAGDLSDDEFFSTMSKTNVVIQNELCSPKVTPSGRC